MTVLVNRTPLIVATVMLFLASVTRWPYGFYQMLRFVVCGTSIYIAVKAQECGLHTWMWLMVGLAILFNPILPVTFRRDDWQVIDFAVGVVLFAALWRFRVGPPRT